MFLEVGHPGSIGISHNPVITKLLQAVPSLEIYKTDRYSLLCRLYSVMASGRVSRDPTGDRPTFVDSSVGSVWIWRYLIDSPVTTSVGPKKQSVDVGSRSWSDRSGRSSLSQISEKSRSGTRASQDRLGFYYVDVTHGAVTGKWYISK